MDFCDGYGFITMFKNLMTLPRFLQLQLHFVELLSFFKGLNCFKCSKCIWLGRVEKANCLEKFVIVYPSHTSAKLIEIKLLYLQKRHGIHESGG